MQIATQPAPALAVDFVDFELMDRCVGAMPFPSKDQPYGHKHMSRELRQIQSEVTPNYITQYGIVQRHRGIRAPIATQPAPALTTFSYKLLPAFNIIITFLCITLTCNIELGMV